MTIDEAVKYCLEVAEKQEDNAKDCNSFDEWTETKYYDKESCLQCAAEHRQLAEWLTDYKELKNSIGAVKLSNMKEALELIREYKAENIAQKKLIAEYKQLLKVAIEDLSNTAAEAYNGHVICKCCKWLAETVYCKCRYADEALKLIGDSENDEP